MCPTSLPVVPVRPALPQDDDFARRRDDLPRSRSLPVPPWQARLAEICRAALNFPVPLRRLESGQPETAPGSLSVLELFHGPTAAFKDVGARFLAHCMEHIIRDGVFVPGAGDGPGGDLGGHRRSGGICLLTGGLARGWSSCFPRAGYPRGSSIS